MAKTKKNTQVTRRKRAPRALIPRAVKLTPTGTSLAAYHAALSDPFASPPTFIPIGSRPGTFVHKRLVTAVTEPGENHFSIRMWSQGSSAWKISAYHGTNAPQTMDAQCNSVNGKVRLVSAAIRVTDLGRADALGGLATLTNSCSIPNSHDHSERYIYKKSVTAHYKPLFPTDYTWYSGNDATDNDDYGDVTRQISVELAGAVDTKSLVEYVFLFEADELLPPLEGAMNYLVGKKQTTHDAGPGAKHVARHASTNHKQRDIDMRNHNQARGPSYIKRLADGVRAAAESGATVMGVVETLNPGSVSGPFKEFLGLGSATEAEMMSAAANSLPMLEAAMDFAPMALL